MRTARRELPSGRPARAVAVGRDAVAAAGPRPGAVHVWRAQGGAPLALEGHDGAVTALAFGSRAGQLLCSASADRALLWDVARPEDPALRELPPPPGGAPVEHCVFDAADALVALSVAREVVVARADSGELEARLRGHEDRVTCAAFVRGAVGIVASASDDRTVRLWDLGARAVLFSSAVLGGPLLALAAELESESLEHARIAAAAADGRVFFFEAHAGRVRHAHTLDLAAIARRQSAALRGGAVAESKVIDARPRWAVDWEAEEGEEEEQEEEEDDDDGRSWAPLALAFFSREGARPGPAPPRWLAFASATHVQLVDVQAYAVSLADLQEWDFGAASGVSLRGDLRRAMSVAATAAFAPQVASAELERPEREPSDDDEGDDDDDGPQAKGTPTSLFPTMPPPRDSWLNDPRQKAEPPQPKPQRRATAPAGRIKNKPVTFHSKIKSSGYGSTPPVMRMFSGGPSQRRQSQQSHRRPSAAAQAQAQYPLDCPLFDRPQEGASAPGDGAALFRVEFASDASQLAVVAADHTLRTLRLPLSRHRGAGTVYQGHDGKIASVGWSHDRAKLVTASADGTARVWVAGRPEAALVLRPGGPAEGVAVSQASFFFLDRFVVTAAGNQVVASRYKLAATDRSNDLKRLQNQGRARRVWALTHEGCHAVTCFACATSVQSHLLLSAGSNREVRVTDAAAERTARVIADAHQRPVHCIALPQPSQFVGHPQTAYDVFLTAAADGAVRLWDMRSPRCAARFSGHVNRVHAVGAAFSPCLRYVAAGSEDRAAYVFDVRVGGGAYCARLAQGHGDVVTDVAYNPVHPQMVTACFDGGVRGWVGARARARVGGAGAGGAGAGARR